jgi:hypothetical protein
MISYLKSPERKSRGKRDWREHTCYQKKAFADGQSAEKSGQKCYRCLSADFSTEPER